MAKVAGLSLSFLAKAALARLASPPSPRTAFPGEKTALTCCYLGKRGGEVSTPAPTLGGLSYYACVTLPLCVPGKSNDHRLLTFRGAPFPSLQRLERVDLPFELALPLLRLFPLSGLSCQLKRRIFIRAIKLTLGDQAMQEVGTSMALGPSQNHLQIGKSQGWAQHPQGPSLEWRDMEEVRIQGLGLMFVTQMRSASVF